MKSDGIATRRLRPEQASGSAGSAAPTPRVTSSELLRDGRELVILHAGREYRLRVTQTGKLILTA